MAETNAFYDRQIEFLENNDVEGMIPSQYNEDAELIAFDFVVKGHDALVAHFKEYIKGLGYLKLMSTEKFRETDDSIFFEATVETAGGTARVYDVFYMQNGKISRHWTGLLGFTPKES
jgi:predicted SnoaL-like aldol condensation-catalyzing enzyme